MKLRLIKWWPLTGSCALLVIISLLRADNTPRAATPGNPDFNADAGRPELTNPAPSFATQKIAAPTGQTSITIQIPKENDKQKGPAKEQSDIENDDLTSSSPMKTLMDKMLFKVSDGEYAEALTNLEIVVKEDPTLLPAWESLGWCYWHLDRKDEARLLWERLLKLEPNVTLPYNCLALYWTGQKDLDKASEYYQKSLNINSNQYQIAYSYAQNLLWRGKIETAVGMLKALNKEDPMRLDIRVDLARSLMAHQEYEEAEALWKTILAITPDNIDYRISYGRTLHYLGDLTGAAEEVRRVLKINEGNVVALTLMADIAEFSAKPEQAIVELRKVADLAKDDEFKTRILQRMAWLSRKLNLDDPLQHPLEPAIKLTQEALATNPRSVIMRLFLGELLITVRRYDEAKKEFENVLKDFNPQNLRAQMGLFEIALVESRFDDAERMLKNTVARFDPSDPYRFYYLARIEYARGNLPAALKHLDRLELEGLQGNVAVLLYHALSSSEWTQEPSVYRFREHLQALQRAGYRFITPDELTSYFSTRKIYSLPESSPRVYRMVKWLKHAVTGIPNPQTDQLWDVSPDKVACVTFDDALRSSLRYATPVAEDLGLCFGLMIPVENIMQHQMGICSWEELRQYQKSGVWSFGSHLKASHINEPVDKEGHLVNSLPNRIWIPDRNRSETHRSYFARLKSEFKDSKEIIEKELFKDEDGQCNVVAYPAGDIGQELDCNIQNVDNPVQAILSQAQQHYNVGFIQSNFGHALKNDNPLLYQRYEPDRLDSGSVVYKHIAENNPVFFARRMRAEIAALSGKLYLAQDMLKVLERDGYPEESLRTLSRFVNNHLQRKLPDPSNIEKNPEKRDKVVALNHPYVAMNAEAMRANVHLEQWRITGKAGLGLNDSLTLEGGYAFGHIDQQFISNNWTQVNVTETTTARQYTTTTLNGDQSTTDQSITTYNTHSVSTNRQTRRTYKSDENDILARFACRYANGSLLMAQAMQRSFSGDVSKHKKTMTGFLEYQWKPSLDLDTSVQYAHDLIPAGPSLIVTDGGTFRTLWRAKDWWDLNGNVVYQALSDKNSIMNIDCRSSWLVARTAGIYLGLQGNLITAEDYNPHYWTPYWEQRYYVFCRVQSSVPRYQAAAELRYGRVKDQARPEDIEAYNGRKALGEAQGWYPGDDPETGFQPTLGADASLRRRLGQFSELVGEIHVNVLNDYTEYNISFGLHFSL